MQTVETTTIFSPSVVSEPDSTAIVATSSLQAEPAKVQKEKTLKEKEPEHIKTQTDKYNYFLYAKDPADTVVSDEQWAPLSMDSVFAQHISPEPVWHESLFTECTMQPLDTHATRQVEASTACWGFVIFAAIITAISLYSNNHRFLYGDIILSAFSVRSMARILRDSNINRESALIPMTLIYAMGLSMSTLFVSYQLGFMMPFHLMPLNFLMLFAVLTGYLMLKNRLVALLGNLFSSNNATILYNQNSHLYNFIAGLLLAPLSLVMFFNEELSRVCLFVMIGLLALLFSLRLFRGMQFVFTNTHHSRLYLIYYLLAFELIPIIVLGKMLMLY